MPSAIRPVFGSRRCTQSLAAALLFLLAIFALRSQAPFHGKGRPALTLPSEYDDFLEPAIPQSDFCNERFTPRYLDDFRAHTIQYCAQGSGAGLRCFQGYSRVEDGVDSLCIAQGAVLDAARQKFALDCELREPDANETSHGLISFDRIRPEWYETGPRWILDHYLQLDHGLPGAAPARSAGSTRRSRPLYTLLVKREGSDNIWHCMMEIWAMTMTLDLLRTTPDPSRGGAPFFVDRMDIANTEVVVLDDLPDGKVLDLWTIFTGRPPVRWKDLLSDPEKVRTFAETPRRLIIPLAGAANPLWQNDWLDRYCGHAPMLRTFVHRVLRFYGLPTDDHDRHVVAQDRDAPPGLNLTFIDRRGSRRLLGQDALLAAVALKYPQVQIRSVDLATLSFAEQLQLVRQTDVLLGVHGAGLTHTMFMREGRGAVVEIQPKDNDYRGFRNLAFMKGLRYFTAFAEQVSVDGGDHGKRGAVSKRDQWHWDDVRIGRDEFIQLVDAAIAAVSDPRSGIWI